MTIPEIMFREPRPPGLGFEVLELAEGRRVGEGGPGRVHRVHFHTVTLIRSGVGEHQVDFRTYPCRVGTLLWVRPGQVQLLPMPSVLDGRHLLFVPAFPVPSPGLEDLDRSWSGTIVRQLGDSGDHLAVRRLFDQLDTEYHRPGGQVSREILRHLVSVLLLHIRRLPDPDGDRPGVPGAQVYLRFREELERRYLQTRRAQDYAAALGCTVKTLTRACLAATGRPVKQVIDARVALEARRLLAHTDAPVGAIARHLGFSEQTNFDKFFRRQTGITPADFRRRHQAGAPASGASMR